MKRSPEKLWLTNVKMQPCGSLCQLKKPTHKYPLWIVKCFMCMFPQMKKSPMKTKHLIYHLLSVFDGSTIYLETSSSNIGKNSLIYSCLHYIHTSIPSFLYMVFYVYLYTVFLHLLHIRVCSLFSMYLSYLKLFNPSVIVGV